ncbi:hypothetical protein Avbf_15533 [Armadillidium vulgare]|nr:hypothetical protein Avbf_15533 [Armadillidium vulgare]
MIVTGEHFDYFECGFVHLEASFMFIIYLLNVKRFCKLSFLNWENIFKYTDYNFIELHNNS